MFPPPQSTSKTTVFWLVRKMNRSKSNNIWQRSLVYCFSFNSFDSDNFSSMKHPAGTPIVSDICDLSKISDIAPLTSGSMEKSFFITYFVSHRKPISVKISGKYIYIEKLNKVWRSDLH